MTPHARLVELVDLLPTARADLARALGVSSATFHGWLRAGRGEQLHKRAPGFAPPSSAVLATATAMLEEHLAACQAVIEVSAPRVELDKEQKTAGGVRQM